MYIKGTDHGIQIFRQCHTNIVNMFGQNKALQISLSSKPIQDCSLYSFYLGFHSTELKSLTQNTMKHSAILSTDLWITVKAHENFFIHWESSYIKAHSEEKFILADILIIDTELQHVLIGEAFVIRLSQVKKDKYKSDRIHQN